MMCFSTDEMKFYNAFEEHGVKRGVHHNYLWGSLFEAQPLQTEVETLYLI